MGMSWQGWGALMLASSMLALGACSKDESESASAGETEGVDNDDPVPEGRARIVHSFGTYEMAPLEEITPCIQWTLNNDKAIYVNRVDLVNNGGYHHSNWYIVPENYAAGPDGFFNCDDRLFTELEAAITGGFLWAQSTQSRQDGVKYPDGVVVKIPPRYKIVANGHLLNLSSSTYPTEGRMSLEIVHPSEVKTVLSPFRLTYYDLDIPARRESRFTGDCNMVGQYHEPFDMKLYYVMPHYHYLGNYFDMQYSGGPHDGESFFRLDGFNADNNGQVYDPPLDFTGAQGIRFTCGFDNWRDVSVGWGIGDQEMCVVLGMADARIMMDGLVSSGSVVDVQNDIPISEGDCNVLGVPKNDDQTMPTPEELAAPLYVPPSDPADEDLPAIPPCIDVPDDALPRDEVSLRAIANSLFASSCTYSSCHQRETAVAGLDLMAADLHGELMNHQVAANTDLPLIAPGDPEGSYLYRLIADCEPMDRDGNVVNHMPLNAPFLSDPGLVAMVRDWIAQGAQNN
jgi:hypothetical protein